MHLLMSCSTYEEERLKLFDVVAAHIPSFQDNDLDKQFELLMCFKDIPVVHQLAHVCMNQRQLLL